MSVPGRVLSIEDDGTTRLSTVSFGGVRREVDLAFLPEVTVGDWVLVHVGYAISRVDAEEAERTIALLTELGELDALADEGAL